MSPRKSRRRRAFAAPFVFTVALAPACVTRDAGPQQPDQTQQETRLDQEGNEIHTKPMETGEPAKPAGNGKLSGDDAPDLPDAPDADGEVVVEKDGTCWFYYSVECPPETKCNPPAPKQVKCKG